MIIREFTLERNLTLVRDVGKASAESSTLFSIIWFTVERSLMIAVSIEKPSVPIYLWFSIRGFIQEKNPMSIMNVENPLAGPKTSLSRQRFHSGEKPHGYSECGKTFSQKGHFIQHQWILTREELCECNTCDKALHCFFPLFNMKEFIKERSSMNASKVGKVLAMAHTSFSTRMITL